jgi:hypothetical protein
MGTFEKWVHSGRLMAVPEKDLPPNPARARAFLEKVLAGDPVRRRLARAWRVNWEAVSIIPPPSDTSPAEAVQKRGRGKPPLDLAGLKWWLKTARAQGKSLREISREAERVHGVKISPASLMRVFRLWEGG